MAEYCAAVPQTSSEDLTGLLRQYYEDSGVRQRMYEFLGGTDLQRATALFIAGTDGYSDYHVQSDPTELPEYLAGALEVDRSLWDRESLIVDIDLEYHNFNYPAEPWLEPQRAFELQQPVLDATLKILGEARISPLILVSGRGFHLVWGVRRNSPAFERLSALGYVPATLQARYAHSCAPDGSSVDLQLGRAFAGLGVVVEFIGHRVLAASSATCALSVQLSAIEVGPGSHGREIISFDLSEYGDPLHMRHVRLPFSAYLKPRQLEWALGEAEVRRLLPIFEIPLSGVTAAQAIAIARDTNAVLKMAARTSVVIPDASAPMEELINAYQASELAAFHDRFYDQLGAPASDYSTLRPKMPWCVEFLLENPNDWLLKPAALQHVVRVLMAIGWSPSSIAQRVCSCYVKDCDWGDMWVRLEPNNRAIFYTRLFAGMIATGVDKLIDFNCVSHQEKGYCMASECSSNLIKYRDLLLEKRRRR